MLPDFDPIAGKERREERSGLREAGEPPNGGRRRRVHWALILIGGLLLLLGFAAEYEARTSWLQSRLITSLATDVTFQLEAGESPRFRVPQFGPYNERLGYSGLSGFIDTLKAASYSIDAQAVLTEKHARLLDLGFYPIFHEKNQAGLRIHDRDGESMFTATYPARIYAGFDSIPPVVWRTLLYIENRELLDERYPHRNPAVEWDRFTRALFMQVLEKVGLVESGLGASTLATQLEKFRYSPGGLTGSPREKLRQMMSASVGAYLDGNATIEIRRQIVSDYLNALPLAGRRGYGEVVGLAEGLQTWYGSDFDEVNRALMTLEAPGTDHMLMPAPIAAGDRIPVRSVVTDGSTVVSAVSADIEDDLGPTAATAAELDAGRAYRQVLSLLLATRRPSYLLANERGRVDLEATTDRFIDLLEIDGVIPRRLAFRARGVQTSILAEAELKPPLAFVGRKASTFARSKLLQMLGVESVYELDHFDLTVRTTFDLPVQNAVTEALAGLHDPAEVRRRGMEGARLLSGQDPANVFYAVNLYEAAADGNRLLVQTDNFEGPFNINAGSKLELGSTAKLRTLINYLQIVEDLYEEHAGRSASQLRFIESARADRITSWALDYLSRNANASVAEMLDAALDRRYSSSPYEQFFTGGGAHVFHNFSSSDSTGVYSVRTGFRHSVNLVFIRMMRDIVNYYTARLPGNPISMLDEADDPRRAQYLARFADREGRQYLWNFYRRYPEASSAEIWRIYVAEHRPAARRFAWAVRAVHEDISLPQFEALLAEHGYRLSSSETAALYEKTDSRPYNWHDRGYLAGEHPLELWLIQYRLANPEATWSDVVPASETERQDAYLWLFKSASKSGQDRRIRTLIEEEAFVHVHRAWAGVGYPFDRLVPSYATAIGSSADRPSALAELVGTALRGGLRYPVLSVESLHFAADTPYETVMTHRAAAPERVFSEEVAEAVTGALVDVVERGTGVRIRNAFVGSDGEPLVVGGKTGTGDNRFRTYTATGSLRGSSVHSRTSTFVFFIGDRYFGTVTAYVMGPEAERYRFTSSLPVQLLKALGPELEPLL
jgi:membrane peptidoglycan carboxypeptidase